MGILGHASPERIAPRLLKQANAYDPYGEPVVPAFELIATVAQSDAGADGDYSAPTDAATIEQYLRAARAMHGLLILDIQPGRASFLREVRRYERFLHEPDVSLALDSEWSMGPQEVPAQVIGGTSGEVVNGVSAYLASLVRKYNLPQKLFYHIMDLRRHWCHLLLHRCKNNTCNSFSYLLAFEIAEVSITCIRWGFNLLACIDTVNKDNIVCCHERSLLCNESSVTCIRKTFYTIFIKDVCSLSFLYIAFEDVENISRVQ